MSFGVGTLQQNIHVGGGTLVNEGPDTLYYRNKPDVTSAQNDGGILAGSSATLDGNQWIVSGGRSAVDIIQAAAGVSGAGLTGVGAPSAVVPDGNTYYEQNAAGQTVAAWLRSGGAWGKVLGGGPYAALTCSAAAGLTTNVETAISFDTVREDSDGMYNATNPTRLTVQKPGIYSIEWRARFVSGTTAGTRHWWIQKNGVTNNYLAFIIMNGTDVASTSPFFMPCVATDRFAANDYVEFGLFQNSGATLNFDKFDPMVPEARMFFVRP